MQAPHLLYLQYYIFCRFRTLSNSIEGVSKVAGRGSLKLHKSVTCNLQDWSGSSGGGIGAIVHEVGFRQSFEHGLPVQY